MAGRLEPMPIAGRGSTKEVERETGLEPATCSLEGCRSAN
jgi:hypothetical protein